MFPRPMAEPIAAITKPSRVPHCSRSFIPSLSLTRYGPKRLKGITPARNLVKACPVTVCSHRSKLSRSRPGPLPSPLCDLCASAVRSPLRPLCVLCASVVKIPPIRARQCRAPTTRCRWRGEVPRASLHALRPPAGGRRHIYEETTDGSAPGNVGFGTLFAPQRIARREGKECLGWLPAPTARSEVPHAERSAFS